MNNSQRQMQIDVDLIRNQRISALDVTAKTSIIADKDRERSLF
jgi:hypothetical protein